MEYEDLRVNMSADSRRAKQESTGLEKKKKKKKTRGHFLVYTSMISRYIFFAFVMREVEGAHATGRHDGGGGPYAYSYGRGSRGHPRYYDNLYVLGANDKVAIARRYHMTIYTIHLLVLQMLAS